MQSVTIRSGSELRQALQAARPGTQLLLAPGEFGAGYFLENIHGAPGKPIVVRAADPARPPRFSGGSVALHLARVSWLEIHDLVIEKMSQNGLNIDDGGQYTKPSHHVTLKNLRISELPAGNRDGIKLSGIDDFRVEGCQVARWGGSGIDMVGCHRGKIVGCTFRDGGDNGVQCKGGTSEVTIQRCRFEGAGLRGVNLGGSTGLEFFRPPVATMSAQARYEARNLTVEGCTFSGSDAPLAFVGVDGATVRFNTLFLPRKWALRILQETRLPEFIACRRGVLESNLIVFRSDSWGEGGVNIGSGTAPETFTFARNFWLCQDRPERSRPRLPSPETEGRYGQDPLLGSDLKPRTGSPALKVGAHALPPTNL